MRNFLLFVVMFIIGWIVGWCAENVAHASECTTYVIGEDIVSECDSLITVTGKPTYSEVDYTDRQERIKEIVDAEVAHIRAKEIEVAKHQVALDLEKASAPRINVSSWSVNRNDITNSVTHSPTLSSSSSLTATTTSSSEAK